MAELWRRISYLLNRRRLDAELESDMAFHREMTVAAGRNNFGNTLRMREQSREAWGWTWLDRLMQDLHYGVRILARSPGFTIMAVTILGIGIGVNIAAFSFFNMVALKPIPVRDAESIVRLERRSLDSYTSEMAYPSFAFYRATHEAYPLRWQCSEFLPCRSTTICSPPASLLSRQISSPNLARLQHMVVSLLPRSTTRQPRSHQ
jgi:hypothetical protein